ncbi:MAG TPA: O-antigen ligase family protein [Solirubrobacteraceae bacterium]|nr:O-antigen ligase family protein [Solirubrobacteraceae bacterium]
MVVAPPHAPPQAAAAAPAGAARPQGERPARALLIAFFACLLYAAFSSGATQLPQESWLQIALAVVATVACAAWLYGSLRLRASAAGWAGLGLLVLFAAWTGASIAWSVAPDRSWVELNRAIAYVLTVFVGLVLGTSLARAPERVARALAYASIPVALYALGGKTLPGFHIDGLINLDQAGGVNRLKAPLQYWNALALFCVSGLLPMLRMAADPWRSPAGRIGALLGVYLLLLVITLTYSRGGMLALIAGLVVFFALSTERVRAAVVFFAALFASSIPLFVALTRPDLIADRVPLERREDDALVVLVTVLVVALLLAAFGVVVDRLRRSRAFSPERARRIGRPAMAVVGALLVLSVVNAAVSGRIAASFESFKDTSAPARTTDPNRLLSANSGNRWTWWEEAAGAWSDKPVAGWGAGSFPVTHKLYRRNLLGVQQPHSVPLQWLAEVGLVGLLLAAGGILALLAAALARVRATPWALAGAPPDRGYAAALLAVAVAWIVHSFLDWDWDIPAVTLPMLLALGVLAARPRRGAGAVPSARGPVLAAAVLASVLVVVSALLPALADTRTGSAIEASGAEGASAGRLADAAADAEVAARLNPLSVEPLLAAATIAVRRGRREEARALVLRALRRQPDNLDAWVQLAAFEFERGDRAGLRRASQRALELDPRNPGLIALAQRAQSNSAPPNESATATGSPLPTQVPITEPEIGLPAPAPVLPPAPLP